MSEKQTNILIVDDDSDDREMLIEALNQLIHSINCKEISNGSDGLQFVAQAETVPDLIFLDLNMPKMGGRQFLLELKQNDKFSKIPVIIYTTSRQEEDQKQTKELGAAGFITKPYTTAQLKKELEQLFVELKFGFIPH